MPQFVLLPFALASQKDLRCGIDALFRLLRPPSTEVLDAVFLKGTSSRILMLQELKSLYLLKNNKKHRRGNAPPLRSPSVNLFQSGEELVVSYPRCSSQLFCVVNSLRILSIES